MGLNRDLVRMRVLPQTTQTQQNQQVKKEEAEDTKTTNKETDTKTEETTTKDVINENIQDNHLYFNAYDKVTENLKDFYSETLAKMKGPEALNKKVFNEIYNKIMNDVVNKSVESAKSGELIKYSQLAQEVKDRVIAELEACNYSSSEYLDNQREDMINDAIKDSNKLNK